MGYLDGFTRPDYQTPDITGLYQFVQSGYDAGKARAQNQALSQLSQKAYTDTGDAQQQDIAQMVGIDPQAGYRTAQFAQQQQATQQAQQLATMAKFGKLASAIVTAKRRGDDTTAQALYQASLPELRLLSAQHGGPEPPADLNQSDMGALYKVAAMYGQMPQPDKPLSVGPDTTLIDPNTHKVLYQGQGDAGAQVTGMTYNGMPVFRDKMGALKDIRGNPIPQGGSNGASVAAPVPGNSPGDPAQAATQETATSPSGQRVDFNFAPGTPPEVIAAAKASAVANGDLAPGSAASPQAGPQGLQYTPAGKSGDVISQRAQQIQELKARGVKLTPDQEQSYLTSGKLDAGFNANAPQPIGDPKLTGQARLQSIDPDNRATVLAVLQGRKAPPTGTASKSSYWMGVIQAANAIDPTFDETSWPTRVKTAQAYSPSGAQGQQIIALNTLVNHIGELNDQFQSLHNTGSPAYNSIANNLAYETGMGAKGLPAYQLNAHAASQEIESLWKKGGGNEADIKAYASALSSSNSPENQAQVIQKMLKLAYGRLQSLQSNYQNSMGIAGHGLNFVNNKSQGVIKSLAPNLAGEYSQGASALSSGQIAAGQSGDPQLDALLKKYGGG